MTLTRRQQIEALEKRLGNESTLEKRKAYLYCRRSRRTAWLDGTSKYNRTTWC